MEMTVDRLRSSFSEIIQQKRRRLEEHERAMRQLRGQDPKEEETVGASSKFSYPSIEELSAESRLSSQPPPIKGKIGKDGKEAFQGHKHALNKKLFRPVEVSKVPDDMSKISSYNYLRTKTEQSISSDPMQIGEGKSEPTKNQGKSDAKVPAKIPEDEKEHYFDHDGKIFKKRLSRSLEQPGQKPKPRKGSKKSRKTKSKKRKTVNQKWDLKHLAVGQAIGVRKN